MEEPKSIQIQIEEMVLAGKLPAKALSIFAASREAGARMLAACQKPSTGTLTKSEILFKLEELTHAGELAPGILARFGSDPDKALRQIPEGLKKSHGIPSKIGGACEDGPKTFAVHGRARLARADALYAAEQLLKGNQRDEHGRTILAKDPYALRLAVAREKYRVLVEAREAAEMRPPSLRKLKYGVDW